jgi:RNA polymerase sigma-70 factor (ECF subfamily)
VRDFKAWVYAISANIHRDQLRKKRIRRMFFTQHTGNSDERSRKTMERPGENNRLTMDESDRVDLGHAIHRAITELPMRQRRVFVLKEVEGFKHAEIGKILGVPVGTVKSLLHRAIRHLRQELSAYDPGASS